MFDDVQTTYVRNIIVAYINIYNIKILKGKIAISKLHAEDYNGSDKIR